MLIILLISIVDINTILLERNTFINLYPRAQESKATNFEQKDSISELILGLFGFSFER